MEIDFISTLHNKRYWIREQRTNPPEI